MGVFSKPHSHGLSDRILKSKQHRQNQFEFNVEQKFSYKLERFDKNVDSDQKCKIWMENDGLNGTIINEEGDHEHGNDNWQIDSDDTENNSVDHKHEEIFDNRKKLTNCLMSLKINLA